MNFKIPLSFFALVLAALLMLSVAKTYALSVDQVRFGVHPDKIRMVVELSQVTDYRVFALDNPYRLVVDIGDFEWRAGKVMKPAGSGIKDIREGPLQKGISRIVFDMDRPMSITSAFMLPRQDEKPDRLVIDYQPVGREEFSRNKETIHGTLTASDINQIASLNRPDEEGTPVPKSKPAKEKTSGAKPLIVIDPGHGGVDPGAVGIGNVYEKNIVLALAKELKKELEATQRYKVIMTRDKDTFVKLADRVKFARDREADLFVSIHADTIHKDDVQGSSIYTLSKQASDKQTAALAEKENKADLIAGIDLSVEDEQVANILFDFARTETMNESKFFANTLVEKMQGSGLKLLPNPHRYAGFAVLKAPDIPSILIEAGFMSNKKEVDRLSKPEHRKKIARSIRVGIDAFFEHLEANEKS